MPRHNCLHCGLYFYSKYRLSSHELFAHGKFIPTMVLPKVSWKNRDSITYEYRRLSNSVKRQESRIKDIEKTKKFRDSRGRRWSNYRTILQFELRKLDAMKKSLKGFEREATKKGVVV